MICIVIVGPTFQEARSQIKQALAYADLVEFCLDRFNERSLESLKNLLREFSIPIIFTLRSKKQGGCYTGSEEARWQEIKSLATCGPAYLILEDIPLSIITEIKQNFPEIKLIVSRHDFTKTPENLDELISSLPKIKNALFKIALMAHSTADALRLLIAAQKQQNLISISMGANGEISRILAPVMGSPFCYSCLEENLASAPGQLPAHVLLNTYRYKSLNQHTELYGLIGSPITGSISDKTHNTLMQGLNLNAVYVKMQIEQQELSSSLQLMKTLGFRGLSVTMPLKENILPYIDMLDPHAKSIGAVNTIHFDNGRSIGYNTDGFAALECIEKMTSVAGKKVIILGAGGAARSIAFEALHRGAQVIILNRTREKAKLLAKAFGCDSDSLEALSKYFKSDNDILINCLPHNLSEQPFGPDDLIKNALVLDITTKPMHTPFLQSALLAGCRIIPGYQMFISQALKQFEIWFPEKFDKQKAAEILTQASQAALGVRSQESGAV